MDFGKVVSFDVDMTTIAEQTIKTMVRKWFSLPQIREKKLMEIILNEHEITRASRAREIIDNIAELCRIKRDKQSQLSHEQNDNDDDDDDYIIRADDMTPIYTCYFNEINQKYLLPASSLNSSTITLTNVDEADPIQRIRYLSLVLGPYIFLNDLQNIYEVCYKTPYPTDVQYDSLSLSINEEGFIRHKNMAVYTTCRALLRHHGIFNRLYMQIHATLPNISAIRAHITCLFQQRNESAKIMGISIHKAITSLYALDVELRKAVQRSLSSSLERSLSATHNNSNNNNDDDDNDAAAPDDSDDSSENFERIANLNTTDIAIIIQCFTEMINHYSAHMDMVMATQCATIVTEFLNQYHEEGYEFNLKDLDIVQLIIANTKPPSKRPFGKLSNDLSEALLELLTTMCMHCYFTEQGWLLRKYTIYGLQILRASGKNSPIIEACVGLILSHSADGWLHEIFYASGPVNEEKLADYKQLRSAVNTSVNNVITLLRNEPLHPSQALAWSMIGAVAANFSIPFSESWKLLMVAYNRGITQQNIFQAILAFGNSIVLQFCAGLDIVKFQENCTVFIERCEQFDIALPKPIIQGFLDFAICYLGSTQITFNTQADLEGPNRFFINFTRVLGLFYTENYIDCIKVASMIHQLEFTRTRDNLRIGYNIQKDFLLIESIALLRRLNYVNNSEQAGYIRRIQTTMYIFSQYEIDFKQNFKFRYEYLMAEICKSAFIKEICGEEPVSLIRQLNLYQIALDSAREAGHTFYIQSILTAFTRVQNDLLQETRISCNKIQPKLFREPEQTGSNSTKIKPVVYEESVSELLQHTKSDLVLLFHVTRHKKILTPNVIYCKREFLERMSDPKKRFSNWEHDAVLKVLHSKNILHHSASGVTDRRFLKFAGMNVKNILVIPILADNIVRAVVYTQGSEEIELPDNYVHLLMGLAYNICHIAIRNDTAVRFTLIDSICPPQKRLASLETSSAGTSDQSRSDSSASNTGRDVSKSSSSSGQTTTTPTTTRTQLVIPTVGFSLSRRTSASTSGSSSSFFERDTNSAPVPRIRITDSSMSSASTSGRRDIDTHSNESSSPFKQAN